VTQSEGLRTRWLVLYGLGAALLGPAALAYLQDATVIGTRIDGIAASLDVLESGGPPLLGLEAGEYIAVGTTDDQGLYLFAPLIGWVTGLDDPAEIVKWMWLVLFAVTIALYPLLFHRLFGSLAAAIAAPFAAFLLIQTLGIWDVYSATAWAIVTLLPAVFLLWQRWPRSGLLVLVLVMVAASFASSIRGHSGLPVLIAAIALLATRPWSVPRRLAAGALIVIAYLAITPLGLIAIREYRDSWVGEPNFAADQPDSHAIWHNAYIGLGYLPNSWRLQWDDAVGMLAVEQREPGVTYMSDDYVAAARELYFDTMTEDPGLFAETELSKASVAIRHLARFWFIALLLIPLLLVAGPGRVQMRRWVLLVLPAVALGALSALVALPRPPYDMGLQAGVGLLVVLAGALLLDPLLALVRAGPAEGARQATSWLRDLRAGRSGRIAVAVSLAGIVALGAASALAGPIQDRAAEWHQRELAPPIVP
jgi:hypothetical protein